MSILARLLRLRVAFVANANFAAKIFAPESAASPRRPLEDARTNGRTTAVGENIGEFAHRRASWRSRARSLVPPSSPVQPRIGSEIAEADLVRFCSDLESMLQPLSEAGKAGGRGHAIARYPEPANGIDGFPEFGAPWSVEADVANAVRKLSQRS